jgi:hypothetical protein
VRGQDPSGRVVPISCYAKRSLPQARRRQHGTPNGRGVGAVQNFNPDTRPALCGEHRHAPTDPSGLRPVARHGEGHERRAARGGGAAPGDAPTARAVGPAPTPSRPSRCPLCGVTADRSAMISLVGKVRFEWPQWASKTDQWPGFAWTIPKSNRARFCNDEWRYSGTAACYCE